MACWSNYIDYECGRNRPLGMAIDAGSRIAGASTKMAISSEHEELVCGEARVASMETSGRLSNWGMQDML